MKVYSHVGVESRRAQAGFDPVRQSLEAVSYTHLDVYKRQV